MRNLVKQEESKNGKYRVSVYYDEYAKSPCTNWDLGAAYLFEYNDHYGRTHRLHDDCSWREVYDPKWVAISTLLPMQFVALLKTMFPTMILSNI